ncbi:FUSC family protein [Streptomyces sp. NPDC050619]|uniref:FUSC family protein n=1 Tax=Streptomyces sp. NPDC050619 TaxID=3157214 RepID=UPI00344208E8
MRVGRPSDIWFKPALSVVVAVAPPNLTLLALGRLDLAMYTMAGSLCALYAHNRPYAARARVLAGVILGMLGGLAVALVAASLTTSAVVLVGVGALLAAVQKVLCDATRVGPPGNVVLTFISSAALFAPQTLGQVPAHLALGAVAGGWAWLVGMAPGLPRPHGPERRAVAHALNAAAAYAAMHGAGDSAGDDRGNPHAVAHALNGAAAYAAMHGAGDSAGDDRAKSRAAAAAAVQAAWQSLLSAGARTAPRRRLERLVVRAETALAAPADTNPERLRTWARALRGTGPIPRADERPAETGELGRAESGGLLGRAEAGKLLGLAEVGEPFGRAETGNPFGPVGTGEPLGPVESGEPLGLAEVGKPFGPVGTGEPLGPVESGEPLGPAETGKPFGPAETGKPFGPAETGKPFGPAEAGEPFGPAEAGEPLGPPETDELLGVDAELAVPAPRWWSRLGLGPLTPLAVRTALGCALAGYVSLALGVGRPYWALVTAASLYQANLSLTWSRGVQRVVGNLAGVLLFAAVVPLAHLGPAALVLCSLALNFGGEALISRNYWLGSVCVTPMALLITEFAGYQQPGRLITERVVDTLVGTLVGLAAAVAVTNRRAGDRVEQALSGVERSRERAARLLAEPHPAPGAVEAARRGLTAALVELRATVEAASGEWWQRAVPHERVVLAERSGHRTLATTARRQGPHSAPRTDTATEDVRP